MGTDYTFLSRRSKTDYTFLSRRSKTESLRTHLLLVEAAASKFTPHQSSALKAPISSRGLRMFDRFSCAVPRLPPGHLGGVLGT
eukprot:SAG31_NODE_35625_length_321_cov_0.918919_1_plen_83_part_01